MEAHFNQVETIVEMSQNKNSRINCLIWHAFILHINSNLSKFAKENKYTL